MIHLRAPVDWHHEATNASARWPLSVALRVTDVSLADLPARPLDNVLLTATAGILPGDQPPLGLPLPGRATACIVGAAGMSAGSFTGWAQRSLLGTANPLIGDAVGWTVPDRVSEFEMPPDARASHHARSAMRAVAEPGDPLDDILLAASELTANAVQHGGGAVRLTAARSGASLTIALTDRRADVLPVAQPLLASSSTGRGLAIVHTISDHWGVTRYHDRKVVWCCFGSATVR